MKIIRSTLAALLLAAGTAVAQDAPPPAAAEQGAGSQYSEKGADTCLDCHDAEADTPSFSTAGIFKSRHAQRSDSRSPFGAGGLQCEACHGPGARHSAKGGGKRLTIDSQKPSSFMAAEERNQPCLDCHQNRSRTGWHAGAHERAHLACADCHRIHVERDAVLNRRGQPEVCLRCHAQQRIDFQKASSHPLRQGKMGCSDCHSAHGSAGAAMLVKPTLNQTCWSCHADKRGPLLWEHAPVAEDCSLCHNAHGSVRQAMLVKSPPLLCQQCHSVAGHPSVPRTASGLPGAGGGGSIFLVAGSCTNCHSQVHGSNHPAGAKLMR
jgi:DmsE family decaheme c-type cytochrome